MADKQPDKKRYPSPNDSAEAILRSRKMLVTGSIIAIKTIKEGA